ncbi:MAG: GAF domain-containing protein, partial [Cyanobacteria bacterium J083]
MDHFAESISISPKLINLMTQTVDINSMLSEVASYIAEITPSEFCWVISDYHNWFRGKIGTNYQDFKQKTPALSLLESKEFFLQPKVKEFLNYSSQTTLELNLDQLANLTWSGYLWLEKINLENSYKILLVLGKRKSWQERELANFQAQLPQIRLILQHISLKQNIALKTNYQKLLNQLTAIISQSKSLATTLDSVLQQLNQTLQIDTSVIVKLKYKNLLESKEENKIAQGNVEVAQFCSSKVLKLQNLANFSLSSSGLLQAGIKQAPQPLIVNNIESLDKDIQLEEIFLSASQAILLVPIMGHQTSQLVIGFLILQQQHPRVWQTEEIELLNWVGVQISNAILNSQTLSRVQSIVDERTAQLTWSLEMQGRLREKMLSQIEQLKSLNELKDDFLNSMSHELKTPLTTMKMAIEMLRQPDLSESLKEKY